MDKFIIFLYGILVTAVCYMAFPLFRLLIKHERFDKSQAKRISLWNSIVVGAIFLVLTTALTDTNTVWNGGPAVLYYWINRSILTKKKESAEELVLRLSEESLHVYLDSLREQLQSRKYSYEKSIDISKSVFYLSVVQNALSTIENPNQQIAARELLNDVTLCGYPNRSYTSIVTGGAIYAVLFYLCEKRPADPNKCLSIDNQQNLMLEKYHELMFPSVSEHLTTLSLDERSLQSSPAIPDNVTRINFSQPEEIPEATTGWEIRGSDMLLQEPSNSENAYRTGVTTTKKNIHEIISSKEKAYDQIAKFHDYYQQGIITEEEYNKSRSLILQSLNE